MAGGLIDPPLACAETDVEIVHARGRSDGAFEPDMFTCDDARGPCGRKCQGVEILALRRGKLELRRQGHPKLKTFNAFVAGRSARMPDATARPHPFDTARLDDSFAVGRLLVGDLP